jgi:hypothetical protein
MTQGLREHSAANATHHLLTAFHLENWRYERRGCCSVYWTTREMRFEFGLTITRWPLTKAVPLPSCLI